MELGDCIEVVCGPLGSGKSAVAHLEAVLHLKAGGLVATNYTWCDNWAWHLAGADLRVWLKMRDRLKYAQQLYTRCWKIGSAESMYDLSDRMVELVDKKLRKKREGKGLLIVDEAHHVFNSREYQKNKKFVEFFANARKCGWRTIIVTHSMDSIDKQIRDKVEYETRFRNLKKVRIPFTPFPFSPIPAFFTVRRYAGMGPGSGSKAGQDLFFLDPTSAKLYDTTERFYYDDQLQEAALHGPEPYDPRPDIQKDESRPRPKPKPKSTAALGSVVPYYERIEPAKICE